MTANAFAPDDSYALVTRRLRQAHTDIVNGQPMERVLETLRMSREAFLKQLDDHAANNPGFVWLKERLQREERIRQLEEENAKLSSTVSSLAVEIQGLRSSSAPRVGG